jgi:hypothetical protein
MTEDLPRTRDVFVAEMIRRRATGESSRDATVESVKAKALRYEDGTVGFHLYIKLTDGTGFGIDSVERYRVRGDELRLAN